MAEAPRHDDELALATPVGTIKAHGFNIVMLLALLALSWLSFTEHQLRNAEHDQILASIDKNRETLQNVIGYQACLQRLNLFVATSKDPGHLVLSAMPQDLWNCLPKFMTEEQQQERKLREGR